MNQQEFSALTQIEMASVLQQKWMTRMYDLFDSHEITSTDLATLARVLLANGWTLDPAKLPSKLRDKLTEHMDLDDAETREELGIVGYVGRK